MWIPGKCDISFWFDKWLDERKLADLITPPVSFLQVAVRDVASNVNNYADVCFTVLLRRLLDIVKGRLELLSTENDRPVWTATSDGFFSLSLAWEICQSQKNYLF